MSPNPYTQEEVEDLSELAFGFSIIALGVSLFGIAASLLPQLRFQQPLKYCYVFGILLMVIGSCWIFRKFWRSITSKRLRTIVMMALVSYIFVVNIFLFIQVVTLPSAVSPSEPIKFKIMPEKTSVSDNRIIKQFNELVRYSISLTFENIKSANLKIKFESPFILENGKTVEFTYNASAVTPSSKFVTLTKMAGVDYVYILVNITGEAKASGKDGKILIEIKPN